MGRKGSWFSSIKKAFSPEKKEKKASKTNKKRVGKAPDSSNVEASKVSTPLPLPPVEELKLAEEVKEQTKHSYSVAVSTPATAEASAPAAAEVVPFKAVQISGKSKEEHAAIKIQTAFRGYLARRALKALRGLVRLKLLVDGPTVKRQTTNALKCMQTLCRVQSQIHSRRNRMLEENRALQRQLLQKHAKELESFRKGEGWDDSLQSKEQIEASLLSKYEAAMRRERALAYSHSHQQTWKKSSRSSNLLFMDPTNPQWGWSWLERWMGARSLEPAIASDKEQKNDQSSAKNGEGEISKAFARHQLNKEPPFSPSSQKPPSSSHHSPATPASKPPPPSSATRKLKLASPRVSQEDEDSKSMLSIQSERNRRHSIAGSSSVRDDESLASFQSIPSYMTPTKSAKAKTRMHSPLGSVENGTPEKGSAGSVKKRLSYPPSPAKLARRHSGPPKVEKTISIADGEVN